MGPAVEFVPQDSKESEMDSEEFAITSFYNLAVITQPHSLRCKEPQVNMTFLDIPAGFSFTDVEFAAWQRRS